VFGGYTFMDSEFKNMGKDDVRNGQPFYNTPKHSFSLWTSYKPMAKLTLGWASMLKQRCSAATFVVAAS
jgi:catecholate siderophore receptor